MAKKVITKKTTSTVKKATTKATTKASAKKKAVTKKSTTKKKVTAKKVATKKQATVKVVEQKPVAKRKTRVRINKLTRPIQSKELVEKECRDCGTPSMKSRDVLSYVCWQCVHEACGDQELPKAKKATGFPRGWAFMSEFVHADGKVYFKGVEQLKLKGTKKPTKIKAPVLKPKKSKVQRAQEKQEALVDYNVLKKQIKKEKRVTYRRKLETQLRKIEKKL